MRFSLVLSAAVILGGTVSAQGDVPPYDMGNKCFEFAKEFDPAAASNPYTAVQQIHMIPSVKPGEWYVAVTATGLTSGGKGGQDILTGTWKYGNPPTVTWDKANAHPTNPVNTSGGEFGFMMLDTGQGSQLYACWDQFPGPLLKVAWYDRSKSAWKEIPVNTPNGYGGDPCLIRYNGKYHVLYIAGSSVVGLPITLTPLKGTVDTTKAPIPFINGSAGGTANSPTPIVDGSGECLGFSHHDVVGNDNDHWFTFDLNASTPSIKPKAWDTTSWYNNGGYAAGRFFDAHSSIDSSASNCGPTPSGYHVRYWDAYWLTGGRGSVGQKFTAFAYTPPGVGPASVTSVLFLGAGPGFQIPSVPIGTLGSLGIKLPVILLGVAPHNKLTGRSTFPLMVPNDPKLKGATFTLQSLAVNPNTPKAILNLSNTAVIKVNN